MKPCVLVAFTLIAVILQPCPAAETGAVEVDRLQHFAELLYAKKYSQLAEETERVLAEGDLDPYVGRSYVKACFFEEKLDRAMAFINGLEAKFPKSGVPAFLHGFLLSYQNDFEAADKLYRKALELEPDLPCVWAAIGIDAFTTAKDKQFDRAEAALRREIKEHPGTERVWACHLTLGRIWIIRGDVEKALQEFLLARKALPPHYCGTVDDDTVYLFTGSAYADLGRFREAVRQLEAIKTWETLYGSPGFALAQAYIQLDETDKAEEVCARLIAYEDKEVKARGHMYLALVREAQDKPKQALDEMGRAFEVLPKYPPALRIASKLERKYGDPAKAAQHAFEYIESRPDEEAGWELYAVALVLQGGERKAIRSLEDLSTVYPRSRWRLCCLVQLTKSVGKNRRAARYLSELRKLDPDLAKERFASDKSGAEGL